MNTSPVQLPYGPLMIDIAGLALTEEDKRRLCHPLVGGMVLFSRNYQSPEQLKALTDSVHALRSPMLPIAIDHEGGRVQRCREGFTLLPPMRALGRYWDKLLKSPQDALMAARQIGYVLAAELRQCGVDFSFTPVLDLDWGHSTVVGDRAFHQDPAIVAKLAGALIEGLAQAGMGACGKHFPGHGWAGADSHHHSPVDERELSAIETDIQPYRELQLTAIMPAHVIYPEVDSRPAGFSPVWHQFIRENLGFDGVIFSDDLSMEGAGVAGGIVERVDAAWTAGCDMLLVCNSGERVDTVLENWRPSFKAQRSARIASLLPSLPLPDLSHDAQYLVGIDLAAYLISHC